MTFSVAYVFTLNFYPQFVYRYYNDIKELPAVSDQDMNAFLAEESRQHINEFPLNVALYQFHHYVSQYSDQVGFSQII